MCFFPRLDLTCEQALNLGDIVKSRLARGTREETRKRVAGVEKGDFYFPLSLAASPLAQIGELACRLASIRLFFTRVEALVKL